MRRLIRGAFILVPILMILAGACYGVYIFRGYQKGTDEYRRLEEEYTSFKATSSETGDHVTGHNGAENEDGTEAWMEDAAEDEPSETLPGEQTEDGPLQLIPEAELPEDAPERMDIDWNGLLSVNEDVVGWISVPAIDISYPVLQAEDNEYYLHRDIYREYLFAGSVFMDAFNSADLTNHNTILYGHNMRDGSMFAGIKNFRDEETVSRCRYFWIYTPDAECLYEICSVHYAAVGSETYTVRFSNYAAYTGWLSDMQETSEIQTGAAMQAGDRVVTLSTCTTASSVRTVVQGKLVWRG